MTATKPPKISELDFRRQIVGTNGLATIFGWESVGWRPAQTRTGWKTPGTGSMAKGWPDLILVRERDRRIVFAELKSESGRLSDEQYRVLDVLRSLAFDGVRAAETLRSVARLWNPAEAYKLDHPDVRVMDLPLTFPTVEIHVWRPSDLDEIARILR